jgi:hypothetical protein
MARIVVITHRHDRFLRRRGLLFRRSSDYMLYDVLTELERRGHEVEVTAGPPSRPAGNAAILHVDATRVPTEYIDCGRAFRLCLNGEVADISKRRVSGAVLADIGDWDGPVIIKSNLNSGGRPEFRANFRARRAWRPEPYPDLPAPFEYTVYESPDQLPDGVLDNPALSVERYVAEPEPDGYAVRFWVFCGKAERCTRYVSPARMLKGANTIRQEPAPVPDELRERRRELGFDYGKFDFVVHRGEVILLDANKTPWRPHNMRAALARGTAHLADGFEGMLQGAYRDGSGRRRVPLRQH